MDIDCINLASFSNIIRNNFFSKVEESFTLLESLFDDEIKLVHNNTDKAILACDMYIEGKHYIFCVMSKTNMFKLSRVCLIDVYGKFVNLVGFPKDVMGKYYLINLYDFVSKAEIINFNADYTGKSLYEIISNIENTNFHIEKYLSE